jgi:hypothetical protein
LNENKNSASSDSNDFASAADIDRLGDLVKLDGWLDHFGVQKIGCFGQGITIGMVDSGISRAYQGTAPITDNLDFTGEASPTECVLPHASQLAAMMHLVAPASPIANLKAVPSQGDPDRNIVAHAIDYCIAHFPRIRIVNLSLWFEPDGCKENRCALCAKVNEAVDAGLVVVVAAGNRGPAADTITCPGYAAKALTVGATWSQETAQWYEHLSILKKWWLKASGQMGRRFGTSFSAAFTSAAIALILSGIPRATPGDIEWALKSTARDLNAAPNLQGAGALRCTAAFQLLASRYAG